MIEDQVPEILAALPLRICDVVKPWVESSPDRPALVEAAGTWSYGQLSSAVSQAQTWLLDSGVRPGDRVMVVCENCRANVAILFALAEIGAWPVLVNARLSPREIDQIQNHSEARLILYTISASPQAALHARRHGAVTREVAELGQIGLGTLNEEAHPESMDPDLSENVAAMIYTSGTTGVPKGVMLTHRNLLFVAAISAKIRSLTPGDRLYGVLPMSHAVGLAVVLLGTLLSGGTLYLSPRFNPVATLQALERNRLTVVLGVPAMFALIVEYAKKNGIKSLKFPALRIISASGAPLAPALKSQVENLFGLVLHNGYGVTECSPTIAQTRIEAPRCDTSVGRVFPGTEIRLLGADGNEVAEGEVGEVHVRGPNVMKGYYRAPEETTLAKDQVGWFNTRDMGKVEKGNLFLVGRAKELIIRFGFNVYPAEIEAVLDAHPFVVRSAVVGQTIEGAEGDEEALAFVEPLAGSAVTAKDLMVYAAHHLAPYKRPSQILLVSSMPTTPTGKVKKDELRKMGSLKPQ
jgi:acyl-CoA synthetase (AMP-forming)/AMP-acid ligase II